MRRAPFLRGLSEAAVADGFRRGLLRFDGGVVVPVVSGADAAAPTGIGSVSNVGSGSTLTFTSGQNVSAGTLVVLAAGWFGSGITLTNVTDGAGNTYPVDVQGVNSNDHCAIASLLLTNAITTSTVLQANWSGACTSRFFCGAFSTGAGAATGNAAGQSTSTAAWDSGAVTCNSGGILFGASYNANGFTTTSNTPGDTEIYDFALAGDSAFVFVYQLGTGASINATGTWADAATTRSEAVAYDIGLPPQKLRPDGDVTTTGWTSTPLWSKIEEEAADGTVITGTAS